MSIGNSVLVRAFCLLLGMTVINGHASDASPDMEKGDVAPVQPQAFEQIDFDSLETTGLFSPKPVKIKGHLLKARNDGKSPGAVLAPACNGLLMPEGKQIRPNYRKMAMYLRGMGITVLLVDGFNPRGFTEICTSPAKSRSIDTMTRLQDSLGGLLYLRGRSDVATDKVFMVTWGAAGSFQAMNKASPYYKTIGAGFAAAVMLYPQCEKVQNPFAPYAPIQMFVGEKDTWNPAASCLLIGNHAQPSSRGERLDS